MEWTPQQLLDLAYTEEIKQLLEMNHNEDGDSAQHSGDEEDVDMDVYSLTDSEDSMDVDTTWHGNTADQNTVHDRSAKIFRPSFLRNNNNSYKTKTRSHTYFTHITSF